MPIRSITRSERTLAGMVNETTSFSPTRPNPSTSEALARLGRVALPPMLRVEAPTDLHGGHERSVETRHGGAGEPYERCRPHNLDRPQAEAVVVEMRLDALHQCVRLFAVEGPDHVAHDLRVGVHAREGLAIARAPAPQDQPLGPQLHPRLKC